VLAGAEEGITRQRVTWCERRRFRRRFPSPAVGRPPRDLRLWGGLPFFAQVAYRILN